MAFTLAQHAALEAAIASGRVEIQYDGKRIRYASMTELMRAYDLVTAALTASGQLAAPANTNRGPSSLAVFDRG